MPKEYFLIKLVLNFFLVLQDEPEKIEWTLV
jgi:hypothetical protein